VRLLFDQNLAPTLVRRLGDLFPGSAHVREVGLERAGDEEVWAYAAAHDYTIVSKDADYHQLSFLRGSPPKTVWIRRGNCSTAEIEQVLRQWQGHLLAFAQAEDAAFLILD
jgi:predicted nuclease of predicted toxin-antitoxin system